MCVDIFLANSGCGAIVCVDIFLANSGCGAIVCVDIFLANSGCGAIVCGYIPGKMSGCNQLTNQHLPPCYTVLFFGHIDLSGWFLLRENAGFKPGAIRMSHHISHDSDCRKKKPGCIDSD